MAENEYDENLVCENSNLIKLTLQQINDPTTASCKILHVNIRSLRKNWNQFIYELEIMKTDWDFILLTEISIKENETALYKLQNYDQVYITREETKLGGGVMLFGKKKYLCVEKKFKLETNDCLVIETSWLEHKLVIILLHRQPKNFAVKKTLQNIYKTY